MDNTNWIEAFYGPKTLFEKIFWPIYTLITPRRAFDMDLYTGRIAFGYIASLVLIVESIFKKNKKIFVFSSIAISLDLFWSIFMMGYIRYALCLEIFAGIAIMILLYNFFSQKNFFKNFAAIILCFALVYQLVNSLYIVFFTSTELSWRNTIFDDYSGYKDNIYYAVQKSTYSNYLNDIDYLGIIDYNSGYGVLLSDTIPILCLNEGYSNSYGEEQFIDFIKNNPDKSIYIISTTDTIERTLNYLNKTHFKVSGKVKNFYADFLSCDCQIVLLEVQYCDDINNNDLIICKSENEKISFNISPDTLSVNFYSGNFPTLCNSGNDGFNLYADLIDKNGNILDTILITTISNEDIFDAVDIKLPEYDIQTINIYFKNDNEQVNYNDWLTILNFKEIGGKNG